MRVAVAADADFPDLDDGWPPLAAALAAEGVDAEVRAWDDPAVDWDRFDVVTVMYAWGYVARRGEFLTWVDATAACATVVNHPALLRWASDKTDLADLAAAGIPVVPTTWVPPGAGWDPPSGDYVVKPTVGSGGIGAARYRSGPRQLADAHVRRLHDAGQTAMVQPYQAAVDRAGETAVVVLGGEVHHAVTKAALLEADVGEVDRLWEREVIAPAVATAEQRDVAEAVVAAVADRWGPPTYARVDLVADERGRPCVLEAELVEPSLFLTAADGAVGRLARLLAGAVPGA